MPKPAEEEVELLTWDPSDGTDEDDDEAFDDELPADENFEGEEVDFDDGDEEAVEGDELVSLEEVDADGYSKDKPAEIPQPDRAKSHPDLPRVKSSAFKRFIR